MLFTIIFMFAGYLVGVKVLENIVFYKKAEDKYGMVYSSKLLKCWSTSKSGTMCYVRLINNTDSTKSILIEKCGKVTNDYNLFVFPKLDHDGEIWYYPVFHKRFVEKNPTEIQLEYCRNGARLSKKIDYLRHSGATSMHEFKTYLSGIISHDNRMISGVIEKKGEKYLFVNALQSEDKLWAIKYRNVDDGKKVLMIYDVNSPSLFAVIDWNPTDEDYDYYNTNEGRKPAFKYLLKLDAIASSSSSMEMEEN